MHCQIESHCEDTHYRENRKTPYTNYGARGYTGPKNIQIRYYVDCTIGYGGHAQQILKQLSPKGKLIGIDKDEVAIKYCKKTFLQYRNLQLFHNSYNKIKDILSSFKISKVNGMLLDLGLSSPQLDSNIRGFSFNINSDLDMRYDLSQKIKASDILNTNPKKKLRILFILRRRKAFQDNCRQNIIECDQFRMYLNWLRQLELQRLQKTEKNFSQSLSRQLGFMSTTN